MSKRYKWISRSALGLLLAGTTVFAQGAPEGELGFRRESRLSAEEQLRQSDAYISRMRYVQDQTSRLGDRARAEKDIIKLNCVNDKLIQIKGNLRVGELTLDNLKMAAARGDEGARSHEFSKLTIMYQKVTVLGQEAETCIGEEIAYVGATQVTIQVDPDITQTDPTTDAPSLIPMERPPLASPH
ncbi:MAG: hypothetical protein IT371_29030 [Deltaproteobacteria bacterium]|nr:hypothetical protein [Deltaproteobacteria bacterium]